MRGFIKYILCFIVALQIVSATLNVTEGNSTTSGDKPQSTKFTHWSWAWAGGCLLVVLLVRQYVKNEAIKKLDVSVVDEMRKRDGVYRIEEYEADVQNGALQNAPKDKDGLIKLKLDKRTKVTHDTYYFRFAFPNANMEFGLPIGGHVFFYAIVQDPETGEEKEIARKYTPTSEVHQKGYCEFVIKVYHKNEHPNFPHGGMMTQYLEKMPIGEYLKMEGPKGKLKYVGCGNFYISKKYHIKRKIGMVAGGSGITPMFQIIQAVVRNKDKVQLSLLFGNRSEKDILIREELEQLQEDYPENFTLNYIIDKAENPDSWKYETGYVTKEILEKYMPAAGDETIILTCGPAILNNLVKDFLPDHMVHMF